jgi:hypothetical protein
MVYQYFHFEWRATLGSNITRDIQIVIAVAYGTIDVPVRVLIMSYLNGTAYFGVNC